MIAPEFLQPDVVLFLHDNALREYGGIHGLRSDDLLHSALGRPVDRLADEPTADQFDLAAAYAFGLASNHPFNDGNTRTAWACCVLFLKLNGVETRKPAADAVEQMVRLATATLDEAAFAEWLRQPAALPASRSCRT